jgi:hypothetical protein
MSRSPSPVILSTGVSLLAGFLLLLFANVTALNNGKKLSPFLWIAGLPAFGAVGAVSGLVVKYLLSAGDRHSALYKASIEAAKNQWIEDFVALGMRETEATRKEIGLPPVDWNQHTQESVNDLQGLLDRLVLPDSSPTSNPQPPHEPNQSEIHHPVPPQPDSRPNPSQSVSSISGYPEEETLLAEYVDNFEANADAPAASNGTGEALPDYWFNNQSYPTQ